MVQTHCHTCGKLLPNQPIHMYIRPGEEYKLYELYCHCGVGRFNPLPYERPYRPYPRPHRRPCGCPCRRCDCGNAWYNPLYERVMC